MHNGYYAKACEACRAFMQNLRDALAGFDVSNPSNVEHLRANIYMRTNAETRLALQLRCAKRIGEAGARATSLRALDASQRAYLRAEAGQMMRELAQLRHALNGGATRDTSRDVAAEKKPPSVFR